MSVYSLDDGGKELPSEIRDQFLSLRRLDAESAELDRKLQEVRKRRDAIYHRLERFCESRAPIRRVPHEVIAIIFSNHSEAQMSRNSSLIWVCKLWHSILMETPWLWSHISLDLRRIEELPLLWSYARACLIRSRGQPLYIRLDARNFKPNHSLLELGATFTNNHFAYRYSDQSAAEQILRPLVDIHEREDEVVRVHECALLMTLAILRGEDDIFLTRWRTFHCHLEAPADDSELADAEGMRLWDSVDGSTDNLVDLVFSLNDFYPVDYWHPTGFPNLNSLQAFSTSLDVNLDRLSLPTATLERLSLLHSSTSDHFLGFASNAFTSLRLLELKFRDWADGWMDNSSTQTIRLPALKVLALTGEGYEFITRRFDAPNLTHLSLEYLRPPEQDTPFIFNTITDLLGFLDWKCESETLRRLLLSTPSLRRMHIRRTRHGFQGIVALLEEMNAERGSVIDFTEDSAEWPYVIPAWDSQI